MRYGPTVILCWTGTLCQREEKNTSANVTHKPAQIGWVKCNISACHISRPSHVYVCVFSDSGLFFWFLSSLSISVPLYALFPPSHSFPSWTKAIALTLFCTEKFFSALVKVSLWIITKIIKHTAAIVNIFLSLKADNYFWACTIHGIECGSILKSRLGVELTFLTCFLQVLIMWMLSLGNWTSLLLG